MYGCTNVAPVPGPIMVRAEITEQQWKALRKAAIEQDVPVQRVVGGLISDYLRALGHIDDTTVEAQA